LVEGQKNALVLDTRRFFKTNSAKKKKKGLLVKRRRGEEGGGGKDFSRGDHRGGECLLQRQ